MSKFRLYLIERAEVDKKGDKPSWHPVARLKADDPLEAIKACSTDDLELYRAVPADEITEATGAGERFPSLTLTS